MPLNEYGDRSKPRRAPVPQPRSYKIRIVTPRPDEALHFTITCEYVFGFVVHVDPATHRTQGCLEGAGVCQFCGQEDVITRWEGYVSGWCHATEDHNVYRLTELAAYNAPWIFDGFRTLRGLSVEYYRHPIFGTDPLRGSCELRRFRGEKPRGPLPRPIDCERFMLQIWRAKGKAKRSDGRPAAPPKQETA